tara:strand:+ start:38 stop:370 length:333 start_codon:yes stop_codon:yes gene_type:complete
MKTYTAGQLEAAFEFCRIVNERGGFRLSAEGRGEEEDVFYEFPDLTCLLNSPDDCEHLPLPPKKVMMQMWRHPTFGDVSYPDGFNQDLCMQSVSEKIGDPYEFVYPEEVK